MASSCAALLAACQGAWHEATHAPFLADCKSGAIQAAQFNAWLVQVNLAGC
jgi:thiaminase